MVKEAQIIGSTVGLSVPTGGVYDLIAKVDTGADGSSIWASGIKENSGRLEFCLLGPSSDKYTGQVIKTKDYKKIVVKNSFGTKQSRYRVVLMVQVEGRRIKARFTLANRQRKSYPALIGRRLLNNRFIVDVSKVNPKPIMLEE